MAQTSTGDIGFEFKHRDKQSDELRQRKNEPFNLLILGNFSGANFNQRQQYPVIKDRPWYRIDCDDIDEVLAQLKPSIRLPANENQEYEFTPTDLDDFHPDNLFAEFPPFQALKKLRKSLDNNTTFAAAAQQLEEWLGIAPLPSQQNEPVTTTPASPSTAGSGSLLDSVLESTQSSSEPVLSNDNATHAWLKQLVDDAVAPYTLPAKDPRKEDYLALLDRSISDVMRALLHHPDFQSLESHWRGLDFILRRVDSESRLNIYLWDICKEELLTDLAQQGDATQSDFYHRIQQQFAAADDQLSAIVSSYEFTSKKQDALMLGIMAKLCTALDCPFIANGNAGLAHCDSFFLSDDYRDWNVSWEGEFAQTWQAVRNMPESHYLALTAPRFLLRYPYDEGHYRIESFKFNELQSPVKSGDLLWAPGAYAVAAVLAKSYNQQGWQMQLGNFTDLERLPIALYEDDGEKQLIPNGECFLSEIMFNRLCDAGLTPITGIKNSDKLKVGPILGLHERAPLLGPWI